MAKRKKNVVSVALAAAALAPAVEDFVGPVLPEENVSAEPVAPVMETAPEAPVASGPAPLPVDRNLETNARESVLQTFDKIVQHTELRLAGLAEGEKVTMKVLCQELSQELGLPTDRLYHLVTLYISRRSDVHVARGQDGGLYRGSLAKKIDPVKAEKLSRKANDIEAKAAALMAEAAKLRNRAGTNATENIAQA